MNKIVFDIETKNTFAEVGSTDSVALDISIVGIHDSATDTYTAFEEKDFPKMWPFFEHADLLIGFNSEHFDLPLLNKYYPGDLSKIKHIDLLKEIKAIAGHRMKLDQIADGTLGVKKSGYGLQAITWWRQGEIEKIKKYCLDDVKITKELYDYARTNKILKYKEGPKLYEIKLDPTEWETKEESAMTFTLPF